MGAKGSIVCVELAPVKLGVKLGEVNILKFEIGPCPTAVVLAQASC